MVRIRVLYMAISLFAWLLAFLSFIVIMGDWAPTLILPFVQSGEVLIHVLAKLVRIL